MTSVVCFDITVLESSSSYHRRDMKAAVQYRRSDNTNVVGCIAHNEF